MRRQGQAALRRNHSGAGFTMIEILVVLAIISLALGIVANFVDRGHPGLDLVTATDQVVATLRLARSQAIARQSPVMFTPAPSGHGYIVDGRLYRLPGGMELSVNDARAIRFSPDGSSSGGTVLLSEGGASRAIHVGWLTGRAAVTGGS